MKSLKLVIGMTFIMLIVSCGGGKWITLPGFGRMFCKNGKPDKNLLKGYMNSQFKARCQGMNMEWTKETRCDNAAIEIHCK
ncbi:MAG: hypothetical protein ABUK01_14850 [Leptospirales bacterium]